MGLRHRDQTSREGHCGRRWQVTENTFWVQNGEIARQCSNRWVHIIFWTTSPCSHPVSPQRVGKGKREWRGSPLRRVDYLMKGNQLERYAGLWTFIHLAWPLLNFHDGLWLFRGRVNGDFSALLQMYYLPFSMRDTSSNQREPCSPLIDGLCVGFKEKRWGMEVEGWEERREGLGAGACVVGYGGRGVSQMSSPLKEN